MTEFYAIGDVARRTGLTVSAIRYYADEGIVAPSEHTDGGFRRYDVHAIARLEVVRTLRDLGAGLEEIRRVLGEQLSLPDLAVTHLDLVERQLGQLQARRAVLRTIVRQQTTKEQVSLMHKLVSMSDDERDRIVDEFWDSVTDGLDVHPSYVERLHQMRPHLPEAPETAQLEAWIELADLVQDKEFRTKLRDHLRTSFGTDQTRRLATPEMMARIERRRDLFLEAQAAQQSGMPTDSPQARDIGERMAADTAEFVAALTAQNGTAQPAAAQPAAAQPNAAQPNAAQPNAAQRAATREQTAAGEPTVAQPATVAGQSVAGRGDVAEARRRMMAYDRDEAAKVLARMPGVAMLTRYVTLVATINGTPKPDPERAAATQVWLAKTLNR